MKFKFKNMKDREIDEFLNYLKDFMIINNLKINNANLYINFTQNNLPVELTDKTGNIYNLEINGLLSTLEYDNNKVMKENNLFFTNKDEIKKNKLLHEKHLENIQLEMHKKFLESKKERERLDNIKYLYLCKKENQFRVFNTVYEPFTPKFNELINRRNKNNYNLIYSIKTEKFSEFTKFLKLNYIDLKKGTNPPTYLWNDTIIKDLENYSIKIFNEKE